MLSTWVERFRQEVGPTGYPDLREIDWGAVEDYCGVEFPQDYKEIVSSYSAFAVNHLRVVSPRWSTELNELQNPLVATREAERILKESYQEIGQDITRIPEWSVADLGGRTEMFQFFPDRPGLLKWGEDDQRGNYYWYVEGPPDEWSIVAEWEDFWDAHQMSMSEYLVRALDGSLECRVMSKNFSQGVTLVESPSAL